MKRFARQKQCLWVLLPILIITLILPTNVMARRQGAKLMVHTSEGKTYTGRLLSVDVKGHSLTLQFPTKFGKKFYIKDIDSLEMKRGFTMKNAGKSALIGFGIGAAIAGVSFKYIKGESIFSRGGAMIVTGIGLAFWVTVFKAISSMASSSSFRKICMCIKTPRQIEEMLIKLKKKAVIR